MNDSKQTTTRLPPELLAQLQEYYEQHKNVMIMAGYVHFANFMSRVCTLGFMQFKKEFEESNIFKEFASKPKRR